VSEKGTLIAVKEAAEIGMLPTTQVRSARVEQLPGMADLVVLPLPLGQGDLTII
jgi:hypothetical protein